MLAFQQHLVSFAKTTAVFSAAWTFLCVILLVGRQAISWLHSGVWDAYPLSSVIKILDSEQDIKYVVASLEKSKSTLTIDQVMSDFLEAPAIILLLIALVLLLVFSTRLAIIEKEISTK